MTKPKRSWVEKRSCLVCGASLSAKVTKCRECKSPQGKRCVVCCERLLKKASRCNACQSFQDKRRYFAFPATVFSLLVAIVGVTSAAFSAYFYVRDYHSQTAFKVTGSDKSVLYLKVWNTGRKPSALMAYRLTFDSLPSKETTLDIDPGSQAQKIEDRLAQTIIEPGKFVNLALTRPLLASLSKPLQDKEYNKSDIAGLRKEGEQQLTLSIDLEESNDKIGRPRTVKDHFPESRIADFITANWE